MELEDALNLGLPPHHVTRCDQGDTVAFRAEIPGYPQCTGYAATADEAVRGARHLYAQLCEGVGPRRRAFRALTRSHSFRGDSRTRVSCTASG
jgi:hypothetical protein